MTLIEALRKLGILRGGVVAGAYKNYKDRPDELMFDNVYDKKKDLVGGGQPSKDSKPSVGLVWLFGLLIIISTIIILFMFLIVGFNIWSLVCLLIWLFLIFKLFKYKNGLGSTSGVLIYFVIFFIISVVFLFVGVTKEEKIITHDTDCKTLAGQYDGKVFTISSPDKLKGEIGFKVDKNTCACEITWHTVFESSAIVKNVPDSNSPVASYDYISDIVFAKEGSSPADGNIDPVFANKDKLPVDPFNIRVPYDFYSTTEIVDGTDKTATTETFHHVMQSAGTFSQSYIDGILGVKKIKIYSRATGINGAPVAEFSINVSE